MSRTQRSRSLICGTSSASVDRFDVKHDRPRSHHRNPPRGSTRGVFAKLRGREGLERGGIPAFSAGLADAPDTEEPHSDHDGCPRIRTSIRCPRTRTNLNVVEQDNAGLPQHQLAGRSGAAGLRSRTTGGFATPSPTTVRLNAARGQRPRVPPIACVLGMASPSTPDGAGAM